MVIFVCSSVTDNLTVRCGQHLYIASQEAMRKEDFLHGRTFEGSNSPRAGVKANNDIFKAQGAERTFPEIFRSLRECNKEIIILRRQR